MKTLRVAERWFSLTRIDDAITMLTEPHVHPVWRSNIWHVKGRDRDLLVDAGMGVGRLREALEPLGGRPLVAVATHRHYDHVGGLHEFSERVGHADDADVIAHPDGDATLMTAGFPPALVAFMESGGTPLGDVLIDALPHEDYDTASYAIQPAPLTRIVAEGDEVDTGDRAFRVLHLPGHTPGSIGLWDAASDVLFSGDAIYDGPLYDFLPESDIPSYVETMRKLRALPVEAVHGGHEPSFGRARMVEICEEYLRANA